MSITSINNPLLTVFTPLYNRRETLKRTYNSLCRQTSKNFLWLIIDDGSTDGAFEDIQSWQQADNGFEIRYIYKENGGMHTSHNTAYENIDTELNTCIDSDDYMPDNAVELIEKCWNDNRDKGFAGIIGLDFADNTKRVIGKELPTDKNSITLTGYYACGGVGDKKLVYRTDIIKNTPPYPVFDGEKYVSLSTKYTIIDQDYELVILNENLCFVEYQLDGSSTNMFRQYTRNPKGFTWFRKFQMGYCRSLKETFRICTHYVADAKLAGYKRIVKDSPKKAVTIFAYLFGTALYVYIKRKSKSSYLKIEGTKT